MPISTERTAWIKCGGTALCYLDIVPLGSDRDRANRYPARLSVSDIYGAHFFDVHRAFSGAVVDGGNIRDTYFAQCRAAQGLADALPYMR